VNGDPCAVAKCFWQNDNKCCLIPLVLLIVCHLFVLLLSGTRRCVSPPGDRGFSTTLMVAKHCLLSLACRK